MQASAALALVLLLVGGVMFAVYVRAQDRQITTELNSLAATADDANDPPPGMELAMRDDEGKISTSDGGRPGTAFLTGPPGPADLNTEGRHFRVLVMDRPEGRVVAMIDLGPYQAGRNRLLMSVGFAELAGMIASLVVVTFFTRRSVRPLARALALQRRFVADASHELRAPLTVLHTRAQMLAARARSGDVEAVRKDADELVADTRVLSDIVDELLAAAAMTTGKIPRDRIDLAALASSVSDSMAPYAHSLGIDLSLFLEKKANPTEFVVSGSSSALRRALIALVDNALGHGHRGGRVSVRLSRDGSVVAVAVSDDGVGIDDESLATLFDRFTHGGQRTTRDGRAQHGIGLALVREIAHAHGGDILVQSAPGQGATFTLALPAVP